MASQDQNLTGKSFRFDDGSEAPEVDRLEDLMSYEILDTEPEEAFDRIARLATRVFDMPISFISFITEERQWHKAAIGLDIKEVRPAHGFCSYAVKKPSVMVVPDAREDPRFADHPVVSEGGLVFYAGAPITTRRGNRVGVLCVHHTQPVYDFDEDDRATLLELASIVSDELELRSSIQQISDHRSFVESILQNIPGVWTVLDEEERVVNSNDTLTRVTGFRADQIENEPFTMLLAPEQREEAEIAIREAFTVGHAGREVEIVTRDGQRIPYAFYGRRCILKGSPHIVTIGIDISDMKALREELGEERDFAEAILNTIPGIWNVRNSRGKIVERNPAFAKVTGYTLEEIDEMSIADFLVPEDRDKALAAFGEVLQTGEGEMQVDLLTKDGRRIPYAYVGRRGMIGGDPYVVTVGIDISDLKEAESEIRDRERTFRQLAENIEEVFWVMDVVTTQIVYVSPAYEKIWGRPVEELYADGAAFLNGIHPDDRPRVTAALPEMGSGDWEIEYRVVRPTGEFSWVRANAFPVQDDGGKVYRIVGIAKDISPERSTQRTLMAARDTAEAANAAKSGFLSRMSHELRTPLNAILGYSQILLMDSWERETEEALEDIEKAGRHLLELINEVLDISRIEAGQLRLSLEPVDVKAVLHEVSAYVKPLATRAAITLRLADSECEAHVLADNQRLKQVLLNLLTNAVKYNAPNGQIEVNCFREAEMVRIEVTDTGRGLSIEDQAKLFQPFERLGLTDAQVEGTGLGLSLSKNLVEVMGGTIGVRSELGKGSSFWVEFPAADSPLDRALTASEAAASVASGSNRLHVVYIEDNLSNRKLLQFVLGRVPDVELHCAMQGGLGVELARSVQPDLLLLDLNLPDMDGVDVIDLLQKDPLTRDIPIVVLSADATPKRITELSDYGIHAYLSKPLDVAAFLRMIEDFRT